MLLFKWVVPRELAVSGMPSEGDVDSITSTFKSVVVLAEEHELLYNPRDLVKRAVQVIYRPCRTSGLRTSFTSTTSWTSFATVRSQSSCTATEAGGGAG